MMAVNQLWLSDLALRLLCVIALDRFGDFVSDEVRKAWFGCFEKNRSCCL